MEDAITIVQARTSSRRLPRKVLMPIGGEPMVVHVLRRAAAIGVATCLATTTSPADDELAEIARREGCAVVRGSDDDVLDRFVRAVPDGVTFVVRVTADCPLFDPAVGRAVLDALRAGAADYVSNAHPPTFPDGLDCEAFTAAALRTAWSEARLRSEREHVTPWIREHADRFRIWNLAHVPDLSSERWTVDDERDLAFARAVHDRLGGAGGAPMSMYAVLGLLEREPSLREINAGTARNEGYRASLEA